MPINFAAAAAKSLRNYRRCQRWFNYRNGKFQLKRSADPSPLLPTDPRPSPHPHLYLKLAGFRCHFLFGLQSKESNEREQKKENNVDNVRDPQPSRFTQSEKEKERSDRCKNLLWDTFAIFPSRSTRYTHTLAHVSTHTVKKVKKRKTDKTSSKRIRCLDNRSSELSCAFCSPLPHYTCPLLLLSCVGCRRLADWQIESAKLNENDIALKLNSTEMPKTSIDKAPKERSDREG